LTKIFLFCSQPIQKKRIFMQYNSNLHNMLQFHGCMFLERETENSHNSHQTLFSKILHP
jgi:hypothetical protein